jgi:hypothetical protein
MAYFHDSSSINDFINYDLIHATKNENIFSQIELKFNNKIYKEIYVNNKINLYLNDEQIDSYIIDDLLKDNYFLDNLNLYKFINIIETDTKKHMFLYGNICFFICCRNLSL